MLWSPNLQIWTPINIPKYGIDTGALERENLALLRHTT